MPNTTTVFDEGRPVLKRCSNCEQLKAVNCFYPLGISKVGTPIFKSWCRDCDSVRKAEEYKSNLERSRARSRQKKAEYTFRKKYGTCTPHMLRLAIWRAAKEAARREFEEQERTTNDRRLKEWSFTAKVRNHERQKKIERMEVCSFSPIGIRQDLSDAGFGGTVDYKTPYDHLVEKESGYEARWLELYIAKLPPHLSRAARDLMEGLPITLEETNALRARAFELLK